MAGRVPLKSQSLAVLKARGVPVASVLDVGVMHGTPELMHAFPDVKHILFEPVAEFHETIRKNYGCLDYELHGVAVGAWTSTAHLKVFSKIEDGRISHATVTDEEAADGHSSLIQTVALDDFLSDQYYPTPYLLKIDVDGRELDAIHGAARCLSDCSVVIVECAGNSLPQRIGAIQRAGFRLFDLCEPCYYDSAFWQCDAIFVRSDLHDQCFRSLSGTFEPSLYECFRS